MPSMSSKRSFAGCTQRAVDFPAFAAPAVAPEPQVPVTSRRAVFSASSLNAFAECERKWFYRYVCSAVEDRGSSASFYGIAFHAALEEFHGTHARFDGADAAALTSFLDYCIVAAFDRHRTRFDAPVEFELQKRRARPTAKRYVTWLIERARKAPFEVIACEASTDVKLGDFSFIGYIDRLDRDDATGNVTVVDYKTGAIAKSAAEYLADVLDFTEFQLPFYYWPAPPAGDTVTRLSREPLKDALLDVEPIELTVVPQRPSQNARSRNATTGSIGVVDLERARDRMIEIAATLAVPTIAHYAVTTDPDACRYCSYEGFVPRPAGRGGRAVRPMIHALDGVDARIAGAPLASDLILITGPVASGKSDALAQRFAALLTANGVAPEATLVASSHPDGARDLAARIAGRLDGAARAAFESAPFTGITLDALAFAIVADGALAGGLAPDIELLDADEIEEIFERAAAPLFSAEWAEYLGADIDPEISGLRTPGRFAAAVLRLIVKLRDFGISPETMLGAVAARRSDVLRPAAELRRSGLAASNEGRLPQFAARRAGRTRAAAPARDRPREDRREVVSLLRRRARASRLPHRRRRSGRGDAPARRSAAAGGRVPRAARLRARRRCPRSAQRGTAFIASALRREAARGDVCRHAAVGDSHLRRRAARGDVQTRRDDDRDCPRARSFRQRLRPARKPSQPAPVAPQAAAAGTVHVHRAANRDAEIAFVAATRRRAARSGNGCLASRSCTARRAVLPPTRTPWLMPILRWR